MSARRVDTFRGRLEAAKVVVEFGNPQAAVQGDGEVITLTDRVALAPETAQRLLVALDETLRRRPRVFEGPGDASPERAAELQLRGEMPRNARPDDVAAQGAQLLAEVEALGVPFRYERSFRIARASLLANRFLLTVTKSAIPGDAPSQVLEICSRLGMPPVLQEQALAHFAEAGAVHFGFEASADAALLKLYLEQAIAPARAEEARADGAALLQHIAYKWDPAGGEGVVTRYLWHPVRTREQLDERLAQVYRDAPEAAEARIAREVLELATRHVPAERLQYLEVQEDGNGRRSFDLNVYDAGLKVQDLRSALTAMRDHFALRPGQFQALYDQVKSRPLGHVAGGTHRNGAGFFNIYHAAA
jgi:hypothetical protein